MEIIRWLVQSSPPLNPPSCQWCHPIFYPLNINFPNSQLLIDHPGNLIPRAALSVCLLVVHRNAAKSKLVVQHGQRHNNWSFWKFWLDCLRDCFHKNSLLERVRVRRDIAYRISNKILPGLWVMASNLCADDSLRTIDDTQYILPKSKLMLILYAKTWIIKVELEDQNPNMQ